MRIGRQLQQLWEKRTANLVLGLVVIVGVQGLETGTDVNSCSRWLFKPAVLVLVQRTEMVQEIATRNMKVF